MKTRSYALVISSTVFISLLVVVACGPQKDYVPVTVGGRGPFAQAIEDCRQQIPTRNTVTVGPNTDATKKGIVTRICEAPEALLLVEGEAVGPVPPYRVVERDVRYGVASRADGLTVLLKFGLNLPEKTPDKLATRIETVLNRSCFPKLRKIWRQSPSGSRLELDISMEITKADHEDKFDQSLSLEASKGFETEEFPELRMVPWPDRGVLYPRGKKEDIDDCIKHNKSSERKEKECVARVVEAANENFCVSLSIMIGHWLALGSLGENETECAPTVPPVSLQAAVVPSSEVHASYMKAGSDPEAKGAAFWAKAKVSNSDVKSVLGPACKSMRNLEIGDREQK